MNNNPKEFISFSHDNLVFENKILEFANRLCLEGIDANVERGILMKKKKVRFNMMIFSTME